MNSVKSVLDNFESSSDNIKIEILLHGDSRLDNNSCRCKSATAKVIMLRDNKKSLFYLNYVRKKNSVLLKKQPKVESLFNYIYVGI